MVNNLPRSPRYWCIAAAIPLVGMFGGCNSDSAGGSRKGEASTSVAISASNLQVGFATGTLRGQRTVSSFKISKHPVTRAEYAACVAAGACKKADDTACGSEAYAPYSGYRTPDYRAENPEAPAVCVGESNAEAYCKWTGGRLPTLEEWLLAARGASVRRFAWGDDVAGCSRHPMMSELIAKRSADLPPDQVEKCDAVESDGTELAVSRHQDGASPAGVEDVLLTPGELLKSDPDTVFTACGGASQHCVVFGTEPGAIDSVEPFYSHGSGKEASRSVSHAYSFRCVSNIKEVTGS